MFKAAFALGALVHSFSGSFAGRFLEASWRRCHSSSGFSLSQFVLFLHVTPDRLMMIRSDLCVEHWLLSDKNLTGLLQLMTKSMFGNVNWYFLLTLQQKIEITDLKPFLAAEHTSVLIILATTVGQMLWMTHVPLSCSASSTLSYRHARYRSPGMGFPAQQSSSSFSGSGAWGSGSARM